MSLALSPSVRAYLVPTLGVAAIAGGVRDLGGGIRALLAYGRAVYPMPHTIEYTFGLAMIIIGLGSLAIGYRALRHPAIVPLTMLSAMIAFLTWQIVMYTLAATILPETSFEVPLTTGTKVNGLVDVASFGAAYLLYRLLRRWLQELRELPGVAVG
jgi:hypothetical protein